MNYFSRIFIAVLIVFNSSVKLYAQYPIFNVNQTANMININPAFVGIKESPRISTNYLYQRNGQVIAYHTSLTTFDSRIDLLGGGVGLKILSDRSSNPDNNILSIGGIYSYHLNITQNLSLKAAVEYDFFHNKLDVNNFVNRYDYNLYSLTDTFPKSEQNGHNIGGGFLFYTRNFICGFSFDHINNPVEGNIHGNKMNLPVKYSLILGRQFKTTNQRHSDYIFPTIVYQQQDKRFFLDSIDSYLLDHMRHISLNINYIKKTLLLGLGYRYVIDRSHVYNAQIGYKFGGLVLAYNIGLSPYSKSGNDNNLASYNQLSIDITFSTHKRQPSTKWKKLNCPDFGGGTYYWSNNYEPEIIPGSIAEGEKSIDFNTEEYDRIYENPFRSVNNDPLSTFSIDVDNASYGNARRFINQHQLPPADAVRIEEFINYFDYD